MLSRRAFLATAAAFAATPGVARARRGSARISLPLTLHDDRPLVEFALRGRNGATRNVLFWIDTGGSRVLLTHGIARALDLPAVGSAVAMQGQLLQDVDSPQIFVGGLEIRVPARGLVMESLADEAHIAPGSIAQGVFPVRLLRDHVITFDYGGGRFGLNAPPHGGTTAPLQVDARSGLGRLEVAVDGAPLGFLLDTGASCSMLSQQTLDDLRGRHPQWPWVRGAYGPANMLGGKMETQAEMLRIMRPLIAGTVELDSLVAVSRPPGTFEQWMSAMTTAPIVGSIGGSALREFVFTIDYARGTATFLRDERNTGRHEFDLVPLTLRPQFNGYVIDGVLAGTKFSAPVSQIVGTTLAQVDGEAVASLGLGHVLDSLRGNPGETRRLTIARGAAQRTIAAPVVRIL